ncbi:SocA family protein [Xanthomonas phaseoli pv. dieffenbachiae]|nr:SocA family protein [Xanthomonas phaseoli pv. dieffenbachiae]MBO9776120.1 SocA family protein [Xanthomonas phaseoli pv. dieffenbachiae]MBO9778281.1 SocA family protein [Xanthomonas phaseoli pv. dieffenbachiae]MBO9795331.1 SocA family protein [Xanthomonas phaseoli pv. dieffenbachiae]MBO9801474.1 SocA family protein [Xanthomonas phaseoli pv. dieffenbachiae]
MGLVSTDRGSFDVQKAIAAIGYLVEQTGESMYSLMKMMYLADKIHLERFGRFIAGDSYVAMEQGPVPSHAYNLVKCVRGDVQDAALSEACRYFEYTRSTHELKMKIQPDYDELSGSDVDCLGEVVGIYQRLGKWAVRDLSHDDAWAKTWQRKKGGRLVKATEMPMQVIAEQYDEAEKVLKHLKDSAPGEAH